MKNIFREIKKLCTDIHKSQEFDLLYDNQDSQQMTSMMIKEIVKF